MREVDPKEVLKLFVARYETQHEAAKALAISDVFLSHMLGGKRPISGNVLDRLGLRLVVVPMKAS